MKERKAERRSGFTLVELMVVSLVIAILASVGIPLMTANRYRAIATEAESALGTIRVAMRINLSEAGQYNFDTDGNAISVPLDLDALSVGDLDGRYFVTANYTISDLTATTFTLTGTGAGDALGVVVTLDQNGTMTRILP